MRGKIMSTKENKELGRQSIKEFNEIGGDVTKIRQWYEKYSAPSAIYHRLSGDTNFEQSIKYMSEYSGFQDLKFSIDDIIAEGNKLVLRYTMQFTHNKTFRGIPSTGKLITIKGVEIFTMAQGKIVEAWDYPDTLGAMTQLGAIPSSASKK
jgi:predicted ester cyclase